MGRSSSKTFDGVVKYLAENWSSEIASEFIENVTCKLNLLCEYPYMGIQSAKEKDIHKLILSKHNILYYSVDSDKIVLLNIYDTRINPRKIDY